MYSKTMQLFLALGLAATLGACGGGGDQATPDGADNGETTEEQASPASEGDEGGEGGEG